MKRPIRYRYNKGRWTKLRSLLYGVSAICLIIAITLLVRYVWHSTQASKTLEELRQEYQGEAAEVSQGAVPTEAVLAEVETGKALLQTIFSQVAASPRETLAPDSAMNAEFISLYEKNKDLVGWLHSDALKEIDFPIVQRDDSHYMNRDFYGRENIAGTVFLDKSCAILPRSTNLVLHGHNMKNGSMFGKLQFYLDENFIKSQPMFTFSTLYESSVYVPYAVSIVSTRAASPQFTAFVSGDFRNGEDMLNYARRLEELSRFEFPVDVQVSDQLLTLATCHGNDDSERLILALRELRPGEEKETVRRSIQESLKRKL